MSGKFASIDPVNSLFYCLARTFVGVVQLMPLKLVALVGRFGGFLFYFLDVRHRRVAVNNLLACLCNSHSKKEILSIARENFCRLGEVYLSALKTAAIPTEKIGSVLSVMGEENISLAKREDGSLPSFLFALGHFGNFELFAKCGVFVPDYVLSTTYRGFRQPWLERLILSLRKRSGINLFDRRWDGVKLRAFMNRPGTITGLLADQSAGRSGLCLPFFGSPLFCHSFSCSLRSAVQPEPARVLLPSFGVRSMGDRDWPRDFYPF